ISLGSAWRLNKRLRCEQERPVPTSRVASVRPVCDPRTRCGLAGRIGDRQSHSVRNLVLLVASLIGKASTDDTLGEDVNVGRGVFDKQTTRKPLALAADAAPIEFECQSGTFVPRKSAVDAVDTRFR